MRFAYLAPLALAVGLVTSCNRGAPSSHVTLSSVDPVRNAFNADSGKVRAIFLASPT
jgi:hypothetical protein